MTLRARAGTGVRRRSLKISIASRARIFSWSGVMSSRSDMTLRGGAATRVLRRTGRERWGGQARERREKGSTTTTTTKITMHCRPEDLDDLEQPAQLQDPQHLGHPRRPQVARRSVPRPVRPPARLQTAGSSRRDAGRRRAACANRRARGAGGRGGSVGACVRQPRDPARAFARRRPRLQTGPSKAWAGRMRVFARLRSCARRQQQPAAGQAGGRAAQVSAAMGWTQSARAAVSGPRSEPERFLIRDQAGSRPAPVPRRNPARAPHRPRPSGDRAGSRPGSGRAPGRTPRLKGPVSGLAERRSPFQNCGYSRPLLFSL